MDSQREFFEEKNPHLVLIEEHGSEIADLYNSQGINREKLAYTHAFENIFEALCKRGIAVTRHVLWLAIVQMDKHKENNHLQKFGSQGQKKSSLTAEQKTFIIEQYNAQSIPADKLPYSPAGELERMHSNFVDQFGAFLSKNAYFLALIRLRKSAHCGTGGKRMRN